MKKSATKSMRMNSKTHRMIAVILSVLLAAVPVRLGAGCCGDGEAAADPCVFLGPCQEKQTMVSWTFRGYGWGTVTVKGTYADAPNDPPVAEASLTITPDSPPSATMVCDGFCLEDGKQIEWHITASNDPENGTPSSGTTANLYQFPIEKMQSTFGASVY